MAKEFDSLLEKFRVSAELLVTAYDCITDPEMLDIYIQHCNEAERASWRGPEAPGGQEWGWLVESVNEAAARAARKA